MKYKKQLLRYILTIFLILLLLSSVLYFFIQPREKPVLLQHLEHASWQFATSVEQPSVDSALWKDVHVGQDLSSQQRFWQGYDQPLTGYYTGWYRLVFDTQHTDLPSLAFIFGKVQEADQIWLNNTYLGRYGIIDPQQQWHVGELHQQRVYPIPQGVLKADNNVLVMQIQAVRTGGGMVNSPIGITLHSDAIRYKYRAEFKTLILQTISLTLLLAASLIVLFLYISTDLKGREHLLFSLLMVLMFIGYFVDSLLFSDSRWKTPFSYQFSYFISSYNFAVLMLYILVLTQSCLKRLHIAVLVFSIFYSLLFFIPMWHYTWVFSLLGLVILLGLLVASLYPVVKTSLQKGERHLIPLFVGLLFFCMSILLSYLTILWFNPNQYDLQFQEIGLIVMILSMIIGYIQRLVQLQFRFKALSLKLFDISEKERQHISRELHDGISQRLAALRLQMQILAMQHPQVGMKQCSDDLLETMEEMGRVLHGLRPLSLEKFGFVPAIQHEIDRVSESADIPITLDADAIEISAETEQHLFRIFQECLSNAVRHAQAETIHVSLKHYAKRLVLSINDDGMGYQQQQSARKWGGLGKITLQERIDMINADLMINIKENQGTEVRINLSI